jgi:hypothetical protein
MVYELSRMAGLAARPEGLHSELALRAAVLREQERMTRGPAGGRRNLHPHEEQAWQPFKTPMKIRPHVMRERARPVM